MRRSALGLCVLLPFSSAFVAATAQVPTAVTPPAAATAAQAAAAPAAAAPTPDVPKWEFGIAPQGGGVFVRSTDGRALFRTYGYAQPMLTLTDSDNGATYEESDFRVRRARIDFMAEYDGRYRLFIELDGAPGDGTALIEAWAQAAYVKDRHHLRAGKFIVPFSTENLRSSRAMDTVERFLALNSLFGLPAVDVQIGAMGWGYVDAAKKVKYQLGFFNGNASAGAAISGGQRGNSRDNNGDKEIVGRLDVAWTKSFTSGIAFDLDEEPAQTLQLSSYTGSRYVAVPVTGSRQSFDVDLHGRHGKFSWDTEWISAEWDDSNAELNGGYVQGLWWTRGSEADGGIQALARIETAEIDGTAVAAIDGTRIDALTVGANVWLNGWTRWQINLIAEHTDGLGNGVIRDDGWRPTLLTQFQIKF